MTPEEELDATIEVILATICVHNQILLEMKDRIIALESELKALKEKSEQVSS